jgi:hypothetical protein
MRSAKGIPHLQLLLCRRSRHRSLQWQLQALREIVVRSADFVVNNDVLANASSVSSSSGTTGCTKNFLARSAHSAS